MPPEEPVQTISIFSYLVTNSPVPVVAVGVLLVVVGIVLVASSKSRTAATVYACVSPLPGVLALLVITGAYNGLAQIASSSVAPKPAEFMAIVSTGIASGFSGVLATVLTMGLAIIAVLKSRSVERPTS